MPPGRPVMIYAAGTPVEAHFVCLILNDAGIQARVESDTVDWLKGCVPFQIASSRVLVNTADAELAGAVVRQYENSLVNRDCRIDRPPESYCFHCGNVVDKQASSCPACGELLDWSNNAPNALSTIGATRLVMIALLLFSLFLNGAPGLSGL